MSPIIDVPPWGVRFPLPWSSQGFPPPAAANDPGYDSLVACDAGPPRRTPQWRPGSDGGCRVTRSRNRHFREGVTRTLSESTAATKTLTDNPKLVSWVEEIAELTQP